MTATTVTLDADEIRELTQLLDDVIVRAGQAKARLSQTVGDTAVPPTLPSKDLARVEAVGEVAARHLEFIEQHGSMTLGDSLRIRREMYGDKVRSTANLFGVAGSGALFHRTTPFGTKRDDAQEVKLTDEGKRIAGLWRQLHP